jgi:hypothetical protein
MVTEMYTEMLEQLEHTMQLNPKSCYMFDTAMQTKGKNVPYAVLEVTVTQKLNRNTKKLFPLLI